MNMREVAADGGPVDAGGHNYATPEHMARFKEASDQLSRLKAPVFLHAGDSNGRLFVVAFDGTGNNKFSDPEHATNVAKISDGIRLATKSDHRLVVQYVEGPGTLGSVMAKKWDSMTGGSYERNIDTAYEALVVQANDWRIENPAAEIRVQAIGFSRGASQVPGFANLLHEQGIPDTTSGYFADDGSIRYERYIAAPGKTPQAVGLFDPVATGAPMKFDRRLPPSVVSGLQITAENELRASFPSDQIIPPGFSEDGRFLNITVPGAHSDVGGGYLRNGLSIRCGNLMRDYCNAFDETPKLTKEFEPADQRYNVLHRSEEGKRIFVLDQRAGVRGGPSGTNERLAPPSVKNAGPVPHKPAPLDPALVMPTRNIPIGAPNTVAPPVSTHRPTLAELAEAGKGPSIRRAVGLGVGLGGTALDAAQTSRSVWSTSGSGNNEGAASQVVHFAGRNVGGWAGAATFASAAGAAGIETGPGALVIAGIGGIVGAVGGEHLANEYDQYRINNQKDAQGQSWQLDAQHGWSRKMPALPDTQRDQVIVAAPEVARRLSYQASNTAVELALAGDYKPRDPYIQAPSAEDARTADATPWIRDPETKAWSRHITDQWLEHGMSRSHVEHASPERAAGLDRQAAETVKENVAQSHLGLAERYVEAYESQGWKDFGKVPPAVQHALVPSKEKVLASDGDTYVHERNGQWSSPGIFRDAVAKGNVREELERTEQVAHATSQRASDALARVDAAPVAPIARPSRMDDPAHPDHELFKQAHGHMSELDKSLGRAPDQYTSNMASALAVQARRDGLSGISQVALSDDGKTLWAVQTPAGRTDHLFDKQTSVPTTEAMTPMDQSAAKWPAAMQQFQSLEQQVAIDRQQAQDLNQQQQESVGRSRTM